MQKEKAETQAVPGEMKMHGNLCLLFSKAVCWKCRKEIEIVAIGSHVVCGDPCMPPDELQKQYPCFSFFCYTEKLPPRVIIAVVKRVPTFKHRKSATVGHSYWVNTCPHCNMIQGDYYMFFEPDEGFWRPTSKECRKFEMTDLVLNGDRILADCVDPHALIPPSEGGGRGRAPGTPLAPVGAPGGKQGGTA